ncbi:MAG: LysM domain-containing protein [Chloroflexota bacterium]|nr:LysM domain-containing protein [Chloroflexota bacterium]
MNRLQSLIDRIPSGVRRILIAVLVLALLAFFFPLRDSNNRPQQTIVPAEPTAPITAPTVLSPGANSGSGSSGTGSTPQPTRTPAPTPTEFVCETPEDWEVYIVQPGDTLVAIAQLADTTVDALVEGNCLANPNRLARGQELVVPALPTPILFPTAIVLPTELFAVTPTPAG